jgi:hypothetical protein
MPVAGSRDASRGKVDAAEAGPKGDGYPAEILDLANWELTLPIAGQSSTSPLEITQPELATYRIDPWFRRDPAGGGVLFRANAAGVTTSNSGYPRSESCYFKAGAYTQSNTSKGDAADAYGEVIIRSLQVTHR